MNRQFKREWLIGTIFVLMFVGVGTVARASDEVRVRWDLIHVIFPDISAGGMASASATDGSMITMTGSGTVQIEGAEFSNVTGGGTWETRDASNTVTGSGTYRVREVVVFTPAAGFLPSPPLNDHIADITTASAGLMAMRIGYSDGSRGILVVSCTLFGSPASIYEGITATKGFVNYKTPGPSVDTVDANHTEFHIQAAHE